MNGAVAFFLNINVKILYGYTLIIFLLSNCCGGDQAAMQKKVKLIQKKHDHQTSGNNVGGMCRQFPGVKASLPKWFAHLKKICLILFYIYVCNTFSFVE